MFADLPLKDQAFIKHCFIEMHFTFQEFRQVVEAARDLQMWNMPTLQKWWAGTTVTKSEANDKQVFIKALQSYMEQVKKKPKSYKLFRGKPPEKVKPSENDIDQSKKNIFGWCPVASEKTVCCNLRTIDAVETCAFGCSYCTIQTFYSNTVAFDVNIRTKLKAIDLRKDRRYHIGTGQSSDALVWGNRNGLLDDLIKFAFKWPNVLLEFKTKSANIGYFLENHIPPNVVCSWSLNPQIIIENEEHYTVSLDNRLKAAKKVADLGIKVSFHFHPIVYYDSWKQDYSEIVQRILNTFSPEQVLFISFGSVTFIKPVVKQIRKRGFSTKILQMELVKDPHGKLTYPDHIKIEKFRTMYQSFKPWHKKVFFYLCMEKADLWEPTLGYVYKTNEDFEKALLDSSFKKIIY
ncbi:MAG: hypothetical protein GF313_12080 [Caldithrix sp.]|nr:hypothetical protein [Caldithrix sp.]